jgi:hypothetical protein
MPTIAESDNEIDDIADIMPEVLLLQTGYLTIKKINEKKQEFQLGFPNFEVKEAMAPLLLLGEKDKNNTVKNLSAEIRSCLLRENTDKLQTSLGQLLALVPYDLHIIDENYYHTLFYFAMLYIGQEVLVQKLTSHGDADSYMKADNGEEYIIEFKIFDEKADSSGKRPVPPTKPKEIQELRKRMEPRAREALDQITARYAQSHARGPGKLFKVGIVVARRTFVLVKFETIVREPFENPV